jgi:hypothetical protein
MVHVQQQQEAKPRRTTNENDGMARSTKEKSERQNRQRQSCAASENVNFSRKRGAPHTIKRSARTSFSRVPLLAKTKLFSRQSAFSFVSAVVPRPAFSMAQRAKDMRLSFRAW